MLSVKDELLTVIVAKQINSARKKNTFSEEDLIFFSFASEPDIPPPSFERLLSGRK